MIDCHVHTARCGHAEGDASAYVAAASRVGLEVIAFTEHLPLPEDLDPKREYAMAPAELPAYVAEVCALKRARELDAPDERDALKVLLGIESDWIPGRMDWVESLLASQSFDVILGSVHFLDDWAFDDPTLIARWDTVDVDTVWTRYFERVCAAARSGLYDVMAHPDLVKKFGHRPTFDPRELYEVTAGVLATAGVAVEVSTGGLRKPVGELYPSADLLAALARAGVPATVGSDSHAPAEVGYGFGTAREALLVAGYRSVVYFENRQPEEVLL